MNADGSGVTRLTQQAPSGRPTAGTSVPLQSRREFIYVMNAVARAEHPPNEAKREQGVPIIVNFGPAHRSVNDPSPSTQDP